MNMVNGLINAHLLDGKGGGREVGWDEILDWKPGQGLLWVNFDRTVPEAQDWLKHRSGLRTLVTSAMLAEETRPRVTAFPDGFLVNLRGINLNPGAEPNDLISVRSWLSEQLIITCRKPRLMALQDIRENLKQGIGPISTGDFITMLASRLVDRMGGAIEELADAVDDMEEEVLTDQSHSMRGKLSRFRLDAISLHRYLSPQRDALVRLHTEALPWLNDINKEILQEASNRLTRYVEDLNATRDRATVTHEELLGKLSERMERNMYMLSLIAGIFLPLGLLTGLLGINVGGMPGTDNGEAFWIVCGLLAGLAGVTYWIFRRAQWF